MSESSLNFPDKKTDEVNSNQIPFRWSNSIHRLSFSAGYTLESTIALGKKTLRLVPDVWLLFVEWLWIRQSSETVHTILLCKIRFLFSVRGMCHNRETNFKRIAFAKFLCRNIRPTLAWICSDKPHTQVYCGQTGK